MTATLCIETISSTSEFNQFYFTPYNYLFTIKFVFEINQNFVNPFDQTQIAIFQTAVSDIFTFLTQMLVNLVQNSNIVGKRTTPPDIHISYKNGLISSQYRDDKKI